MSSEIDDVLDAAYEQFIASAVDTGCVWALEGGEGWAVCPSTKNDALDVLPLWSEPERASIHCRDEWAEYRVIPISFEELLDDWLPGMHEDVLMVGVDWNEELEGDEVEPLDLLEDFDKAIAD